MDHDTIYFLMVLHIESYRYLFYGKYALLTCVIRLGR